MKKIKIFLGAYVNFPNAQNVNCDNIARYLDKEKFEVHTMYTHKKPIDKKMYKDQSIHLHKLIHHRFIWYWCKYLTMLFGNYDIYYLPKMELVDERFAKKHPNKCCISSIEGVVGEQIETNDLYAKTYLTKIMKDSFSISCCIQKSAKKCWDFKSDVLYLGIDQTEENSIYKEKVKTVVWIGSVIKRKRPEYFLECAKNFPNLKFILIGDGDQFSSIKERIKKENINNIVCLGRIPNRKVYQVLKDGDLFLMTSGKEGLPKVIGEAMSQRVPAIYINERYEVDYIQNGVNGFAVSDLETMKRKIKYLIDNPKIYQKMSNAAYESIQPYTWKNVIKQYEKYFEKIYEQKNKGK